MNGFIFENWPTEYKYLRKEMLVGKFEDIICFCIKSKLLQKKRDWLE